MFVCPSCGRHTVPLDALLAVPTCQVSPRLAAIGLEGVAVQPEAPRNNNLNDSVAKPSSWLASSRHNRISYCCADPYDQARAQLERLYGVSVATGTLENLASRVRSAALAFEEMALAQGVPVGPVERLDVGCDGAVESAVKQLVGMRAKGPGMQWKTPDGIQAVLSLRAIQLNGEWGCFWDQNPLRRAA